LIIPCSLLQGLIVSFSGLTPVSSTGQAPNPVFLFLDSPIKSGNDDVLCIIFGIHPAACCGEVHYQPILSPYRGMN